MPKYANFLILAVILEKWQMEKYSTFGAWLQTDLDSAVQNLMEPTIKIHMSQNKVQLLKVWIIPDRVSFRHRFTSDSLRFLIYYKQDSSQASVT